MKKELSFRWIEDGSFYVRQFPHIVIDLDVLICYFYKRVYKYK
jgi:hypothetical protein